MSFDQLQALTSPLYVVCRSRCCVSTGADVAYAAHCHDHCSISIAIQ